MSVWAAKRKLTFIGVFSLALLILVLIFGISFLNEDPTCFDGKQNGGETGIDVGGPCQILDPVTTRNIVPIWTRAFGIAPGVYNVVTYFENQNPDAGVYAIKYRFRVYDDENVIITEQLGETFIGPNQRSAILEAGVEVGNRIPAEVFFDFLEVPVWREVPQKFSTSQIVVTEQTLRNEDTVPRVDALLTNRSADTIRDIDVIVLLYDAAGNAITSAQTFVAGIPANSSKNVVFTWPLPLDRQAVRIEVIPRFNVFLQTE